MTLPPRPLLPQPLKYDAVADRNIFRFNLSTGNLLHVTNPLFLSLLQFISEVTLKCVSNDNPFDISSQAIEGLFYTFSVI